MQSGSSIIPPSYGDKVLLNILGPDYPEIAETAQHQFLFGPVMDDESSESDHVAPTSFSTRVGKRKSEQDTYLPTNKAKRFQRENTNLKGKETVKGFGKDLMRDNKFVRKDSKPASIVEPSKDVVSPVSSLNRTITPSLPAEARDLSQQKRSRLGLPIIFDLQGGQASVMSCADSGSDNNAITLEYAQHLGFKIEETSFFPSFSMANGKTIRPIGAALAKCSLSTNPLAKEYLQLSLLCSFYVFQSLAVPIVMGMAFLEATSTLTKHRNRLIEHRGSSIYRPPVMSMGVSRRNIACRLNDRVACAKVDFGSDLNLLSPNFAVSRGFTINPSLIIELQFADGSTGYTSGAVDVTMTVGEISSFDAEYKPRSSVTNVQFHILRSLSCDVLIGQFTERDLLIFEKYEQIFIGSLPMHGLSEFNILRQVGKKEKIGLRTINFSRQ
jgi:hypothetical protein